MNALLAGNHPSDGMQAQWDKATDGGRALMALHVYSTAKDGAKEQIVREYPELREAIEAQWGARADALRGTGKAAPAMPAMPQFR